MKRTLTFFLSFFLLAQIATAQQDAMFTKYMFNGLIYNPGYAGSKEYMSINLIHRTQWLGIDGGPNTQSFTLHTPLRMESVGVGLSVVNDVVGPNHTVTANMAYTYRIPLGSDPDRNGKLAIGLQGGVTNWRMNLDEITRPQQGDEAFDGENPNMWLPNFVVGLYYYSKYMYLGVASPHLIEHDLRENGATVEQVARMYRHYYLSAGAAIPLDAGEDFVFKPSLLVKNVGLFNSSFNQAPYNNIAAPTEFDIDLSMMFYRTLWIGASFRSAIEAFDDSSSFDSADVWAAYYLKNGLRIGLAYDYTLTKLQGPSDATFEVMLGYEFSYDIKKVVTPRYF